MRALRRCLRLLTADLDGRLKLEQDRLAYEDLASLRAEVLDLVLLELDGLAGAVSADWVVSYKLGWQTAAAAIFGRPPRAAMHDQKRTLEKSVDDRIKVNVVGGVGHV